MPTSPSPILAISSAWLLACSCQLLEAQRASAAEPPGALAQVRSLGAGALAVAVRVADQTAWMLIDTGATRSRIDAALAGRLGLVPTARHEVVTLGGEHAALCQGPIELGIAGVGVRVDCLSWSSEVSIPLRLDGVLGADALAGLDLLLDASAPMLRVAPPGTLRRWVDGDELRARWIEGRPAVAVRWGNASSVDAGLLVLDSGADAPILFGELARGLGASPGATRWPPIHTSGGLLEAWAIRLRSLGVDGRSLARPITVLLPQVDDRREAGLLPPALLGPTLFALHEGVVVAGARLRRAPSEPPFRAAATGLTEVAAAADARASGALVLRSRTARP